MRWLRRFRRSFNALLGGDEADREVDEEMRIHLEMEAEDLVRTRGLSPEEARREARVGFGGAERFKEEARDMRRARPLENLVRDASYGVRGLRRSPGFAAVAVLSLGVGIGGTVAIFSVVEGVLLRPLPYPQPESLVTVWGRFLPESGFDFPRFPVAPPEFWDYQEQNRSLEDLAAYHTSGATLTGPEMEPQRVTGARVTGNFFGTVGVSAALGRTIQPGDDPPGGAPVVVLGHRLWQTRYGGDPSMVGRTIMVDGEASEVLGVMPPGFAYPGAASVLWRPLGLDPAVHTDRTSHFIQMVGRMAPAVTLDETRAELATLMSRWKSDYPGIHTGHFLIASSLTDDVVGSVRGILWVLLGAVFLVLLIACANVANLMLARSEARAQEMAMRGALGARRRRLMQQMLTESVILSTAGGVVGMGLAWGSVRLIMALGADAIPRSEAVGLHGTMLVFAVGVTALTALLFGLAPALRAGRHSPAEVLREGARGGTGGRGAARMRAGLVVAEMAVAVLVAAGAALMIRSFETLNAVDPGFDPEGVLMAQLSLPSTSYPDAPAVAAFHRDLKGRLEALPGVTAVSAASNLPLYSTPSNVDFEIEGAPAAAPGEPARSGDLVFALPDYPAAMGIRMLEGRFFHGSDDTEAPWVAVVNRTAARMFWGDRSPVGSRIRASGSADRPWSTVVGVIDDVKWASLDAEHRPAYYVPVAQGPWRPSTGYYTLRVEGDPLALAPAVRNAVGELDQRLPLIRLASLQEVVSESLARPRFAMVLLSLFGAVALGLGAVGIYGVMSYSVARRRRELGIRMAFGAGRGSTGGLVLRQGMRLAFLGVALGVLAALASTRFMSGLLYGVSPTDPLTLAIVSCVLLGVAFAACWIPAFRAVRLDPVEALRTE